MHVHFSNHGQNTYAEADILVAEVSGAGTAAAPLLNIPVRPAITFNSKKPHDGVRIESLSARLHVNHGTISRAEITDVSGFLTSNYNSTGTSQYILEFQLDAAIMAALERLRNGGDLKINLDLFLSVHRLHGLIDPNTLGPLQDQVWGYVQSRRMIANAEITISRDIWITRVLPYTGYGVIHTLEFPAVPIEACASLDHAFKALQQAQHHHLIGHYDDAVGKCRVALDPFFEMIEKTEQQDGKDVIRRVPILKRSWETRLGTATYEWLDRSLGALKEASNPAHHSPNSHFDQLQSQMIIAITTAVVAYAARTGQDEPEPAKKKRTAKK